MLLVAGLGTALGAVRVEDALGDCLDRDALDEEVRAALGDAAADRVEVVATLFGVPENWLLNLVVSQQETKLFERSLSVHEVDCPLLPELVARSVERGLAQIPGWGLPTLAVPRPELALAFSTVTPPARFAPPADTLVGRPGRAPHFSIGPFASVPIDGIVRVEGELFGFWSAFDRVGSQGAVQVVGAAGAIGPALLFPAGRDAVRVGVRGTFGPQVLVGHGFTLANAVRVVPYSTVRADLGYVWRRLLHVTLRAEVVSNRIVYIERRSPNSTVEPPLRLGLVIAIGGPLKSGEARARDRR